MFPTSRVLVLAMLPALTPCIGAHAQGATPLAPGMRFRFELDTPHAMKGTVISTSNQQLEYVKENSTDTATVKFKDLTRLDVFEGRHSRLRHGLALGGFAGAAIGLIIGGATNSKKAPQGEVNVGTSPIPGCSVVNPECVQPPQPQSTRNGQAEASLRGAGIGLLGGALIGGIWGDTHHFEIWKHVRYQQYQVYMSVAPIAGNAVAVHVSLQL